MVGLEYLYQLKYLFISRTFSKKRKITQANRHRELHSKTMEFFLNKKTENENRL